MELVLFVCWLQSEFSKGILSVTSTYVVPQIQPGGHISWQGRHISYIEFACSCYCARNDGHVWWIWTMPVKGICSKHRVGNRETKVPRSTELSNTELNRPTDFGWHDTNLPEHAQMTTAEPTQIRHQSRITRHSHLWRDQEIPKLNSSLVITSDKEVLSGPAKNFKIVTEIGRHIGFMLIRSGHTWLVFIWSSSSTIKTQV